MLINCYIIVNYITLQKITVQIHWIQDSTKRCSNTYEIIQLEYKLQNHLVLFIIREAEHLIDYINNISVNFHVDTHSFSLSMDTPEPFFSLVRPQIEYFNQHYCDQNINSVLM